MMQTDYHGCQESFRPRMIVLTADYGKLGFRLKILGRMNSRTLRTNLRPRKLSGNCHFNGWKRN